VLVIVIAIGRNRRIGPIRRIGQQQGIRSKRGTVTISRKAGFAPNALGRSTAFLERSRLRREMVAVPLFERHEEILRFAQNDTQKASLRGAGVRVDRGAAPHATGKLPARTAAPSESDAAIPKTLRR